MQSFKAASTNPEFYSHSSFYFRGDDSDQNQTHFTDLGDLEQSVAAFPHDDAVVLSPTCGRICCRACPPAADTFCYSAVCQLYALCQGYSEEDRGKRGVNVTDSGIPKAGSVRISSSLCSVVGLNTTYGRTDIGGLHVQLKSKQCWRCT